MADVIEITAEVRERELRLTSIPMMPSGSRNHLRIRVAFDAEWDGTTKTLVAYRDLSKPYHVPLGLDGTALIPHEVLAEQGVAYLGVFGVVGDQRITSTIVRYGVNEGAITEGLQPSDPTPEMWEQLISAVNEVRQAAESAMRDAQTAAQGAQRSAQAAAGSAAQADGAATRAETAADTATTAAGNAETAKTDAQSAQQAAAQSAADAQQAANRAEQAAGNLNSAVTQAQDAAQAAQQSATQAQGHAKSAGDSAASAAQDQQGAADAETAARQSAAQAQKSQETAAQAATNAGYSARQASGAQTAAQNSATAAGQQANAAATSAQQAQQSQTAAAGSAASAQESAAEATEQASASEASAVRAERAAEDAKTAADRAAAMIDDGAIAVDKTWSSRHIIDMLCPPINETGNPVVCTPVAGYPLGVKASWEPTQEGVGDPSPENIRPIIGRDSVAVNQLGLNLLDFQKYYPVGTKVTKNGVTAEVMPDGRVHVYGDHEMDGYTNVVHTSLRREDKMLFPAGMYFASNEFVVSFDNNGSWLNKDGAFTLDKPLYSKGFYISVYGKKHFDFFVTPCLSAVEYTSPVYPGFTQYSKTLTLPKTVYGGEVDAVTGDGNETWGIIDSYAGEHLPGRWISDRDVYSVGKNPTTGAQVAYQLSDPSPFTATGAAPVAGIAGTNTILTDADSVTVTGRADPTAYYGQKIAEISAAIVAR